MISYIRFFILRKLFNELLQSLLIFSKIYPIKKVHKIYRLQSKTKYSKIA